MVEICWTFNTVSNKQSHLSINKANSKKPNIQIVCEKVQWLEFQLVERCRPSCQSEFKPRTSVVNRLTRVSSDQTQASSD